MGREDSSEFVIVEGCVDGELGRAVFRVEQACWAMTALKTAAMAVDGSAGEWAIEDGQWIEEERCWTVGEGLQRLC